MNDLETLDTFINTYLWLILPVVIVAMVLKGIALWKAARNNSVGWFVALLILNTLGILELLYILVFSKKKK